MKLKYIKSLLMVVAVAFFAACDPVVDEVHLKNNTSVEGVELIATQNAQGGNTIELKMNTPGVTGYWDYNLGRAYTDRVEIVYPIPGTSTFTFTGTIGSEFFTKTIDVTVNVLDTRLDQDWYDLVSEDTSGGKTWVFDGGPSSDGGFWWFMSAPGGPENAWSVWWNAAGECCPPVDAAGKMKFDLNGAANFTYHADASASGDLGSFVLDVANQTIQVNGPNILGGATEGGNNPSGLYNIITLTEDKLVLYAPNAAWATGWTYVFRPE